MAESIRNRKFRLHRLFLWIISCIFMLLITTCLIIFFSAKKIINNHLSDFIYQKTDSIYRLDFENISFDLKNRSITFSTIALKPDSISISNFNNKQFYEFETNSLTLSGLNLKELIKDRRIHSNSLKVNNPNFKLSTGQDVDIKMFKAQKIEKGDTLFLPLFREILIDTILVTDAHLKIDSITNNRKVPKLNLEVLQFKIGGIKQTDSPFPFDVEDISLKIENLQENLADKVHIMTVDEINLSLLHSKIRAKNVSLKPYSNSLQTAENQYRIKVPEIEISSPHVENFYLSNTIPIDTLKFISPSIEIKFGNKVRSGTPINQINLFKLIEKKLYWINIGQFFIHNAEMKLFEAKSDEVAQQFENLNINFTQFKIDSTSYRDKERILSAKDLTISIEKFTLNHSDKVHRLVINNLIAETKNKKFATGIISFRPINPSNKLFKTVNNLIDIECSEATFKGVQFNQMYHNQIIPMDELAIRSPEAVISFEKVSFTKKPDKDISLILQKTSDYIKGIYVKKTSITDGVLNYNYILDENKNGFFRTKFQFELKGLSLDSITFHHSKKIFFADNFKVRFKDIELQLADNFHRLQTDSIIISSVGKTAEILNFRILPTKSIPKGDSLFAIGHPEIFDIHFPNIQLSGVDFHKAFFQKELSISNFNILKPSINIEFLGKLKNENSTPANYKSEFYSLISNYLFKINIESLKMDNGQLNLVQHRKRHSPIEISNAFSIRMINFEIDSLSSDKNNKLFFSDDVDLILKKYSFTLADGVHKVDADEIGILSTEKLVYFTNARMYPDIRSENFKKMPVTIFANFPTAQFSGANIRGLINSGQFNVNTITFSNPEIKLMLQPEIKQVSDSIQSPQLIINGLKSFNSNQIFIKNATLELANYSNLKSKTFATTTVDLSMNNFFIENDQKSINPKYGDFTFSLKNTQFNFSDKTHVLSIGKTDYRSSGGLLKINDFKIQQGKEIKLTDKKEFYTLLFPEISLFDFNIIQFLEKKIIKSPLLTIKNPTIELKDKKTEKSSSFNPYQLKLYPKIKDYIKQIQLGQVEISNAVFMYEDTKNSFSLKPINLVGKIFLVDENSDQNEKLLSCDHIILELNNLNGKTKSGFYNYEINKITLNEAGLFSLTGMSLIPAYSEAEFNRKKIYQEDYVTINKADCHGQGFDLKRLIDKKEIAIEKSNFTIDKVEIYRNNHYPIPPNLTIEMPQKELRSMKQKFIADSIFIHCNRFNYRELEPHATNETRLFFTDINSTISHLTNINQQLVNDPEAHLRLNGKLMGKGEVNLKLDMNIQSLANQYRVEAECGPMPLQLMNPVTEVSMKLSIKEGVNNNLTTYFEANEDTAVGFMKFSYSDLKISVLSDKDGMMNEDKFVSFIANTLAVKRDNPRQGKILTPVSVNAKRDKQRSFINYCWVSVFSGIKNTFGIKEKEE